MLNTTSVKSARQNFTNLRQVVSIKIRRNILPYMQLRLSMRLPQCFESYCTPVDDLELLNGRFVDSHYERGFPSLTSLIIIICVSLLSKTLS